MSNDEKEPLEKESIKEEEKSEESEEEEERAKYLEDIKESCKIAKEIREYIRPKVKVGAKVLDLVEEIENKIYEKDAAPSFPCNISINNIAAHYTAHKFDETEINEGDVVKVDFGCHIDGAISDQAFTVSFNPEQDKLIEAAEEALQVVLDNIKPGVETNYLGGLAEEIIKKYGYLPVSNLSGHQLEKWILHSKKTIPIVKLPSGDIIEEGETYAMEVFASTGLGEVHDTPNVYIYRVQPVRVPLRNKLARKMMRFCAEKYQTLPFAKRWLIDEFGFKVRLAIRELTMKKIFYEYHPLADKKGSFIAQKEHTLLVEHDSCKVLTE
ncbi:MAG: type II methionyl aminopeptidase [Promethearchaeota archaeon]|nr:MAG: type II methionyl aminopeptidase [Candidatus Lokiarchaeota archaeon]